MSSSWWWLIGPVGVTSLGVVAMVTARLVEMNREVLASVPLLAEQVMTIEGTGKLLLHAEGPRFTRAFAGLEFHLTDLSSDTEVPLDPVWIRAASSGGSRSRLSLRSFELQRAGSYRLVIRGLRRTGDADHADDTESHRIVITPDHRSRMAGMIVGLIVAALALFGSIGFSIVLWLTRR